MKLLIVDDHIIFREGLASIIRVEPDIEIVGMAGSVREAVEMAGRLQPDIILMDFSLPDGTGVDATHQILKAYDKCGIIFLTMSDEDENLLTAIRAGARGYLLKDTHPSKLVSELWAVFGGDSALASSMTFRLMKRLSVDQPPEVPHSSSSTSSPTLTFRELDVIRALADGKTNEEIGKQLFLSTNTVKFHVHSILDKLHLKNRKDAAAYARISGLTQKD